MGIKVDILQRHAAGNLVSESAYDWAVTGAEW